MRPTDVIVTGFVKSPVVLEQSLAPLRALRFDGVIRHIHYVSWDSPELDPWLAPLSWMSDIKLTRVPQPGANGNAAQRGVAYQVTNLDAGLKLLNDEDALVLKTRPDFIATARLLRDKIMNFDRLCAPVSRTAPNGIEMPAPVLAHKIWVPWADANNPFGYEDAAFLGTLGDIRHMVTKLDADDLDVLGADMCGTYAHVVRFGKIFRERWPLFKNYLRHYDYFPNDFNYRTRLVPALRDDAFFWHLVIAHAWILYSQFHVDCGAAGDVRFYPNYVNEDTDWSRPETIKPSSPYDCVDEWRAGTHPGHAQGCVNHVYARLLDDAWQTALFNQPMPDLPPATLAGLMTHAAASGDGRLAEFETAFFAMLDRFYSGYWKRPRRAA
ncbi:MAG TPA: hypothetical protein VMU31_07830 [Rhizomicrobium sp.]|nr:hypothetical protein [Rhizomicrobium sp.]